MNIKNCNHNQVKKVKGDGAFFYTCKVCFKNSCWYDSKTNKVIPPEELFLRQVKMWLIY